MSTCNALTIQYDTQANKAGATEQKQAPDKQLPRRNSEVDHLAGEAGGVGGDVASSGPQALPVAWGGWLTEAPALAHCPLLARPLVRVARRLCACMHAPHALSKKHGRLQHQPSPVYEREAMRRSCLRQLCIRSTRQPEWHDGGSSKDGRNCLMQSYAS